MSVWFVLLVEKILSSEASCTFPQLQPAKNMSETRLKQLRIKTGVLKRCCKELISYQKEAEQIQEKIKKMQDEGQEVYYIKKQDLLLQETQNVIPDCQKRFNSAFQDLKTLVDEDKSLEESEEYQAASASLQDTSSHVTA
ncbi:hypothetical protein O3P69_005046 [Scylla paramamosain]|uniref:Tubulin-specific chaperone A n=2 Tax=Scylla TaxID=6760 RepID=A0AAW0U9Q1_SCYPA